MRVHRITFRVKVGRMNELIKVMKDENEKQVATYSTMYGGGSW